MTFSVGKETVPVRLRLDGKAVVDEKRLEDISAEYSLEGDTLPTTVPYKVLYRVWKQKEPDRPYFQQDFEITRDEFGQVEDHLVAIPKLVAGSRRYDEKTDKIYEVQPDGTEKLITVGEKTAKAKSTAPLGWLGILSGVAVGGAVIFGLKHLRQRASTSAQR